VAEDAPAFSCPRCGRTSHHPLDAIEGYCGACHDWTEPRPYRVFHYDRAGRPMPLSTWAEALEATDRHVAVTDVGPFHVSTVWLGLDHQFGQGPPLIFETMIFVAEGHDDPLDSACWRYPTEAAALAGHDQAVALVRDHLSP
jgi:hypothetical protein